MFNSLICRTFKQREVRLFDLIRYILDLIWVTFGWFMYSLAVGCYVYANYICYYSDIGGINSILFAAIFTLVELGIMYIGAIMAAVILVNYLKYLVCEITKLNIVIARCNKYKN